MARLPDMDDGPIIVQIHAKQVCELPITHRNQLANILNKLEQIKHKQRARGKHANHQ